MHVHTGQQPMLCTERLLLMPLADRHLDLEVQLDSDPEVLRYISGRARSRDEVIASHAQRMTLARKVDGLGYWMAFGSDAGARGTELGEVEYELTREMWEARRYAS